MFTNIDVCRPIWINMGNEPDFMTAAQLQKTVILDQTQRQTPPKAKNMRKKKKNKTCFLGKAVPFLNSR